MPALQNTLATTLMVMIFLKCAGAETLLNLTFDDPQNLLKSQPEGATNISPNLTGGLATIASGTGGRALPQIAEGPVSEKEGHPTGARLQVLQEPPFGSKPFFRASLDTNTRTRNAGLGIVPSSPGNSLKALVGTKDQFTTINGAIDFFFRMTAGSGSPKFVLLTKVAQMGVVLSTIPESHQLTLKVFTGKNSIDLDGDKTGDKAALDKIANGGIDSDVIYHAALVFRTSENGSISVDFCLQAGLGPMDPAGTSVASIEGFWLLAEPQKPGVDKIVMNVGYNEASQQTMDVAAFRIFSPVPSLLPGLEEARP